MPGQAAVGRSCKPGLAQGNQRALCTARTARPRGARGARELEEVTSTREGPGRTSGGLGAPGRSQGPARGSPDEEPSYCK